MFLRHRLGDKALAENKASPTPSQKQFEPRGLESRTEEIDREPTRKAMEPPGSSAAAAADPEGGHNRDRSVGEE